MSLPLINLKEHIVEMYEYGVLDPFLSEYVEIIRAVIDVIPECRDYYEDGFPKDWIELDKIREKLSERGFGKIKLIDYLLSMIADVAEPTELLNRIEARNGKDLHPSSPQKYTPTIVDYCRRRGSGKYYVFIKDEWLPIWKKIYYKKIKRLL